MSREPRKPEATPEAEKLDWRKKPRPYRRRGAYLPKNADWDKIKVFKEPEYRVPWKLALYSKGKQGAAAAPEPWIQAAIESGLAVMEPRDGGGSEWLEPLGDHPPARMTRAELEALINQGIQDMLDKDKD
jgi:hypothetical protein